MKTITRPEAEKLNADKGSQFVVCGYDGEMGVWGQGTTPEKALENARFNYHFEAGEDFDLKHVFKVVEE